MFLKRLMRNITQRLRCICVCQCCVTIQGEDNVDNVDIIVTERNSSQYSSANQSLSTPTTSQDITDRSPLIESSIPDSFKEYVEKHQAQTRHFILKLPTQESFPAKR